MQNVDDCSPLFLACQLNHVEAARALLSAGAKVDLQASGGCTPLFVACKKGKLEILSVPCYLRGPR